MTITVRLADPRRDAEAVSAIYRPVVEESHTSFESRAPEVSEMASRMERILRILPWLVADEEGRVVGYAYAAPHRERAAYRWSVDVSVYLHENARGRGVGRRPYDRLLEILGAQGYVNVYAGIALPNPASEALHKAIGMELIGIYRQVGFKFGRWWDVAWYGMRLPTSGEAPSEVVPLPELSEERPIRQ